MSTEKYRHLNAGEARILDILDKHPDVACWPEELKRIPFQQCSICKALDFEKLVRQQKHHSSWDALKEAAHDGCHTCKLFYLAYLHELTDISTELHERIAQSPVSFLLGYSSLETMIPHSGRRLAFRVSTLPSYPSGNLNEAVSSELPARFIEDDPGSDSAVSVAKEWMDTCFSEHKYCKANDSVPLPTRVIDIGTLDDTGNICLLVTNGLKSKYIALSHCWGGDAKEDSLIRKCTLQNYERLSNGFPAANIPENFQDAIRVARKLNVQYIWIDSFCIIQNSSEDWRRESGRMSNVYGNSYLAIYASVSSNSDTGFLRQRERNRYLMTQLLPIPGETEHWLWARWPETDPVWSMDEWNGRLWHRAWAFQELVLPPRVLEYAPTMMHFRCNCEHKEESSRTNYGNAHDAYKEMGWVLDLPALSDQPVLEHPTFSNSSGTMSIYRRWYKVIEGFAGRELTIETDRLPAISGLAAKIQQINSDEYLAGLWRRDLAAGLCWGIRFGAYLEKPSSYIAPSWSWASTKGLVTHHVPQDKTLKYTLDLLSYDIETDPLNPFGAISSASIKISAPMRILDISQNTVRINSEWDYDAEKNKAELEFNEGVERSFSSHLFPLKTQKSVSNPLGTGICEVCFDFGPPSNTTEVTLVQLMAEDLPQNLDSSLVPDGITLQELSSDKGTYIRIGVFRVADPMIEWTKDGERSALLGWQLNTVTIV